MKIKYQIRIVLALLCLGTGSYLSAQLAAGVYIATENSGDEVIKHKLTVSDNYLVHTVYTEDPPKFMYTQGGFYQSSSEGIQVELEFNSQFKDDGNKELNLPLKSEGGKLILGPKKLEYAKVEGMEQDLDGHWLFATRGPDTGQERRDDSRARKTLKILGQGSFQWIAYNTESFEFFGTGGGSFTSKDGTYIENIEFFSRDDSRVGAQLDFKYELKDADWHHTGKNSRGEPMYEIWSER